jgi:hypothetical protein
MAGSRERFNYVSDSAEVFTLVLDESNGRATAGGDRITPDRTVLGVETPRGFKPRYVLAYVTGNPLIRRKFIVGDSDVIPSVTAVGATISAPVYANADDTAPTSVSWTITAYRGEQRAIIPSLTADDTGLDEGTT